MTNCLTDPETVPSGRHYMTGSLTQCPLALTGPLVAPQQGQVLIGFQVCEPTVSFIKVDLLQTTVYTA